MGACRHPPPEDLASRFPAGAHPKVKQRPVAATAVVCLGLYLLGMDLTIVNVAIPSLQSQLKPSMAEVQWIVAGYGLALGGTVLTAGAVTDRIGRQRAFVIGLTICGVASAVGALAATPGEVVGARCGMGAGAALLMPATLSIITDLFHEPLRRRRAVAVWGVVGSAGAMTGPVVGGMLVQHYSWRAGFWINLPLVVVTVVLAWFLVPRSGSVQVRRIDVPGATLSGVGLLLLVWALVEAPTKGWRGPPVVIAGLAAMLALVAFVFWQSRSAQPMLPLAALRDIRLSAGAAALALLTFTVIGALFVLTLYLQGVLGYTPWQAGVRTLPLTAAMGAGALAALPVLSRGGKKATIVLGLMFVTAAFVVLAGTAADSGYPRLLAFQLAAGFGTGLVGLAGTEAVMSSVPPGRAGLGSAINDATRQVGAALGIAVQGSLLTTFYRSYLRDELAPDQLQPAQLRMLTDGPPGALRAPSRLPSYAQHYLYDAVRTAFTKAMSATALAVCMVTLSATATAVALSWLLHARRQRLVS
ncbi:MFS transporter [Streptomyces melanogenes]|uniref:MFS transporter n=1 Tax=Streptomyces melanogenes TaxID=67326 RepID=UPI0037A0E7D0